MVKRQTVWLSTMMVLSLMLIGYYTMNNPSETTSAEGGTATTSVVAPTVTSSSGSTSTTPAASAGTTNPNDFFVSTQTQLDKNMSEQLDNLRSVVANANASPEQIGNAETSIKHIMDLRGEMANARDAVLGDGYKECVIVPDAGDRYTVYVESKAISPTDAVKIMNLVSQQLGVSMANIIVTAHA
ncbi:MAG: SpoIIIAH-like family protein [Alicyclobacillaceae bacterium]|nr:SpoIIIAH-like family protein [Alicyclobacillaceae bacterium]